MTPESPTHVHVRDIAQVGALLGEPARIAMLVRLLDGRFLPAGELARAARVSASTASEHLAKLLDGELLRVHAQGRHRYYAIVSAEVAHAVEAICAVAPVRRRPVGALAPIERARACYDHIAGRLAVDFAEALVAQDILRVGPGDFAVTAAGATWLAEFGVDIDQVRQCRRQFAPVCLDWTERRPHVGGSLGAALAHRLFDLGWVKRTGSDRALRVTVDGREGLARTLGLESQAAIR